MNLKSLLSGITLLVAHLSIGQVTKEHFGRAVDYLNCRLSQLSLEKDPTFGIQAANFHDLCPCATSSSATVIDVLEQMDVKGTLVMAKAVANISDGEFQRFITKKPSEVASYLTNGIVTQKYTDKKGVKHLKYTPVATFLNKLKPEEISDLRSEIEKILNTTISPKPNNNGDSLSKAAKKAQAEKDSLKAIAEKEKDLLEKDSIWPTWIPLTLGMLLGLLAGVGLTFLYFRRQEMETISSLKESTGKPQNSRDENILFLIETLKKERNDKAVEITRLKEKIITLETAKTSSLSTETKLDSLASPNLFAENKQESDAATQPTGGGSERFFSIPDLDERQRGFWFDDNGSGVYRPHVSTYRLVLSSDQQLARFEVASASEAISKLISSRVSGVLPVCTELNAYSPDARRITTKTPGKARREGDRWVVTEQAQIEYA